MIYQTSITIPANTPKATPVTTMLEVNKGLVYQVSAIIPSGCVGLAGIRVIDGLYQAFPATPEEWFIGDGSVHTFEDTYIKDEPPYTFEVQGYNLDDTYEHTLTIMIGLVVKEIFIARFLPTYAYKQLVELIAQTQQTNPEDLDTILNDLLALTGS